MESFNHFQIKTFLHIALLSPFPLLFFFDPFLILVLNHSASSCCKNKILLRHEKTRFLAHAKTKAQISCAVNAQLISAFVFAIQMVQSLFFPNPKFQVSFYLSSVAVQSGLCQICPETPKTGFLMTGFINILPLVYSICIKHRRYYNFHYSLVFCLFSCHTNL